ncbi:unnamed protein product, partial [Ectocarpus sp. 8 AP-2014]
CTCRDWARLSVRGCAAQSTKSTRPVAQAVRCTGVVGTVSDGGVRGPASALGIICTTAESRTKESAIEKDGAAKACDEEPGSAGCRREILP